MKTYSNQMMGWEGDYIRKERAAEIAAEADAEIARMREVFTPLADALLRLLDATEGFAVDAYAKAAARTALSRAGVEL